tara:strand:+ start:1475 stop:2107 length:633 start_codon:yes stop_codon:yes gene_type:complete
MYFSITPNVLYDEKPISYPFSESDRVIAKNFFRRYKLNDDIFSYAVFFNKYAIQDGERPDALAEKLYGNQFYDWVILLTNNMVNAQYDWPLSNYALSKTMEREYDDPYNEIHHYETVKVAQYPSGLRVDKAFYDKQHKLNINGTITILNGTAISAPITVADHLAKENEKKREIYILKEKYLRSFVNDFKKQNQYKKGSGNYLGKRLKITG